MQGLFMSECLFFFKRIYFSVQILNNFSKLYVFLSEILSQVRMAYLGGSR
jgi:hypothetical protein